MRPGFSTPRLHRLMLESIGECRLNLTGRFAITEAATGAYVVTPVLAALAGAEVQAFACATRYGSVEQIGSETFELAKAVNVEGRIEIVSDRRQLNFERADLVTNSGHLRPLDTAIIQRLKKGAVIPLMYESWEFREADLDLEACHRAGISVAGTNERHPALDVFSFLGAMALKLLFEAGIAVYRSRIVLLCDNPFAPFIARVLKSLAAALEVVPWPIRLSFEPEVALVATKPLANPAEVTRFTRAIGDLYPSAAVVQYWGELDRSDLQERGVAVWPPQAPEAGHMAILPGDIGPEAIIRLQAGGLKVAEVLLKPSNLRTGADTEFVQPI